MITPDPTPQPTTPEATPPPGKKPFFAQGGKAEGLWFFWLDLHPLWKSLIVLVLLAVLALPFYGTARRIYGDWKYTKDYAAAKEAMAAGHVVEARDLSLSLLRRKPDQNEPLPLFMRAAQGAGDPRLVDVARGFLTMGTSDKADRLFAWQAVSKESALGMAGILWLDKIREDERTDPDFLIPWMERQLSERLFADVAEQTAKFELLADPRLQRLRLLALARQGTPDSCGECQKLLFTHLAQRPDDGPMLLPVIDEIPQSALLPASFESLGKWLKARGGETGVEDRVRLARCEIAAMPQTADVVLDRERGALAPTAPLPLAQLLSALGRHAEARERLQPLVDKGEPAAFEWMARTLEALGDYESWDKLLASPPEGVFKPAMLCDRAYIATQRGDDERVRTEFEHGALTAAGLLAESDSLIRLARHAVRRGMVTFATDVWVKAITGRPASPLPSFTEISPVVGSLARDRKDTALFEVLAVYHRAEPGNPDAAVQYHYLACLNGAMAPAQVIKTLGPLREILQSVQLDCTLAFAHLMEGTVKEADQLTGNEEIDWFQLPPSARAIRAIILDKTGRKEEAAIYLEDFPWEGILFAEARVFRELLEDTAKVEEQEQSEREEKSSRAEELERIRQARRAQEAMKARKSLEAKGDREQRKAEELEKARALIKAREERKAAEAMAKAKAEAEARASEKKEARDAAPETPVMPP